MGAIISNMSLQWFECWLHDRKSIEPVQSLLYLTIKVLVWGSAYLGLAQGEKDG